MKKIISCFSRREWIFVVLTFFVLSFQVWLDLKLPDYMSEITTLVQTEGSVMSDILVAGGFMLLCAVGGLILTIAAGFFAAQIAAKVARDLRQQVFEKTLSFSMSDLNEFTTGSLITRTTNDITQIQTYIALGYVAFIRAPLMAIFAISKIVGKNLTFSVAALIGVATLAIVLSTVMILSIPKSKKLQALTDGLNTVVREHLTGVRVVRAYNAEEYQENKFEKNNEEVRYTNTFVNRTTAMMAPYMTFLFSSLNLAIYWLGATLITNADMTDKLQIFSDMVVFSSYTMLIVMAFMMLTMTFIMLPRVVVALGRVKEVIDFDNTIKDGNLTESDNSLSPVSVEFKNVSFSYPNSEESVLEDISFSIKKGETTAFIGSTGSGKSTIVNLILRFYDCTKGEILIDGMNIKKYTQEALRQKMGLVSQKAILFSGDITSNIAYGIEENIDDNQVKKAVSIAQAEDFIGKTGRHGRVSQGGLNLSGGQKQRLSIARALYRDADIYIFDDCFSALDYRTDRALRKDLLKETAGATKLMVAQRISTVKDADQIIVLDGGKVVGADSHRNLLKNCNVYIEIAHSQLSKEELEHA